MEGGCGGQEARVHWERVGHSHSFPNQRNNSQLTVVPGIMGFPVLPELWTATMEGSWVVSGDRGGENGEQRDQEEGSLGMHEWEKSEI